MEANKALVWITISDGGAMKYHHTQQRLQYWPRGSCNDRGHLMVCSAEYHKIHRYTGDGQPLDEITLPDNVNLRRMRRGGETAAPVTIEISNMCMSG